jgi:hypothetical protein
MKKTITIPDYLEGHIRNLIIITEYGTTDEMAKIYGPLWVMADEIEKRVKKNTKYSEDLLDEHSLSINRNLPNNVIEFRRKRSSLETSRNHIKGVL